MDRFRAKIRRDLTRMQDTAVSLGETERHLRNRALQETPVAGEGLECTRSGWTADAVRNALDDLNAAVDALETFALGDVELLICEANGLQTSSVSVGVRVCLTERY